MIILIIKLLKQWEVNNIKYVDNLLAFTNSLNEA